MYKKVRTSKGITGKCDSSKKVNGKYAIITDKGANLLVSPKKVVFLEEKDSEGNIVLFGTQVGENDLAVKIDFEGDEFWVPKSVCSILEDGRVSIKEWFVKQKEIV